MNRIRVSALLLILLCLYQPVYSGIGSRLDSLYLELDRALENRDDFETKRLSRIEVLKNHSRTLSPFSPELYDTNLQMYREYKQYQCDSAIVYLNRNMEIAQKLRDDVRLLETKLHLASCFELSGLYKESVDLLDSIDESMVPPGFIAEYYYFYHKVYMALESHTIDKAQAVNYRRMAEHYDALLMEAIGDRDDEFANMVRESSLLDAGLYGQAAAINDVRMTRTSEGSPEHALAAYHRAVGYAGLGNREMEEEYLLLSALSDVKAAIRDYASLWMLAELLFARGDIDRAYNYITVSWEDILFYNARLRKFQVAGILSMIDQTHRMQLQEKNEAMRRYMLLVTVLVVLLAVALFFLHKQMRKLGAVRNELELVNGRLKDLNHDLEEANASLTTRNGDLAESNMIKEQYIGRFMNMCSVYIDKLDAYRRMANKKIRDGQVASLLQITSSSEGLDADLRELYKNFDTTFLQLFPDFVNQFNGLLHEHEAIVLKKDELLNTELRIFALIRLGIDDSVRIAEFLRYSLNTIYNYRAKVRNKARVSRDEFEDLVRQIR